MNTKERIHRHRGLLIGLVIATGVYALAGFFLVPFIVRRQLVKWGSEALHREVTLDRVHFNPFTFAGGLDQLTIANRGNDDAALASCESVRVNFDPIESLLRWQWRFGDATLIAPKARLVVAEDGTLNIADLFEREDSAAPSKPPSVGVDRLTVERGLLDFIDRSLPTEFSTTVDPINFTLEEFATKADAEGAYQLTGSTGRGETFTWTGNLSAVPFASQGRLEFSDVAVAAYQPFVAAYLNGDVRSGTLNLATGYDLELGGNRRAQLRDLNLNLADLHIHLPGTETPAIDLPSLKLALSEAEIFNRTAQVDRITLDGLKVNAVREADGTFDLVRLFELADTKNNKPADGGNADVASGPSPQVQIERVSLQNGSVTLIDRAVSDQPVELQATQIKLVANGASTDFTEPIAVEMSLSLRDGPGLLTANGTVTPQPLAADLELAGSQIDVAVASPYLQPMAAAELVSGRGELQGRVRASREGDQPLNLRWTGQAAVDGVKVTSRESDQALVEWEHFGVEGSEFTLSPLSLTAQKIQLRQPTLHVMRSEDGALNLTAVMGGGDGAEQKPAETTGDGPAGTGGDPKDETGNGPAMAVTIEAFTFEDGTVTFTDRAVEPAVELTMSKLEGTMTGLSTQSDSEGKIQLTGTVVGTAPLNVEGDANVLGPDVFSGSDVTMDLRGVRLEPMEPYVMQFLGYRVRQGRMQGDFEYKLTRGKLDGSNHIVLQDFYLGESVPSPDALNVPIKLALSVLRNSEGEVVLNVPVGGSLTSPDFDFAQTIRSAVGTALGNVASAPFKFLGSLFGAPDEDLSQVEFPPGRADITDETNRELEVLTRALQDRPGLKLVINWSAPSPVDREEIRRQRLVKMLEEERNELAAESNQSEITEEEALQSLYVSRIVGEQSGETDDAQQPESASGAEIASEEGTSAPWYTRLWRFLRRAWSDEAATPESPEPGVPEPAEPLPSEEQMRQELLAAIEVAEGELTDLARSRAQAARERLINAGIAPERVAVAENAKPAAKAPQQAQVSFELQPAESAEVQASE